MTRTTCHRHATNGIHEYDGQRMLCLCDVQAFALETCSQRNHSAAFAVEKIRLVTHHFVFDTLTSVSYCSQQIMQKWRCLLNQPQPSSNSHDSRLSCHPVRCNKPILPANNYNAPRHALNQS